MHFEETCFESNPWIITSSETGESLQPKRCLEDQEGDDDNVIDWAALEDSAPSAEEYIFQSDDESDKLDPNNINI